MTTTSIEQLVKRAYECGALNENAPNDNPTVDQFLAAAHFARQRAEAIARDVLDHVRAFRENPTVYTPTPQTVAALHNVYVVLSALDLTAATHHTYFPPCDIPKAGWGQ